MAAKNQTKAISLIFGAPSLTGVDANDLVKGSFVATNFPLTITVTNAADIRFISQKCHLEPCYDTNANSQSVTFESLDELHRFASDAETIAELNKREKLLSISVDVVVSVQVPEAKAPAVEATKSG